MNHPPKLLQPHSPPPLRPEAPGAFGLIVIGDEILSGKREDKHLPKVIELLGARGLALGWAEYVGDSPARITAALKRAFDSGDVVFSTGGIGATPDDHTRQCAARALGVDLALHPQAAALILERMQDIAREQGEPSMARTWYERVLDADPRNDEIAQLLQELATAESAAVSVVESVPEPVAPTEPAETLVSEVPQFLADATELPAAEVDQPADLALPFHSNEVSGAYDAIPALAGAEALPLAHAIPALADLTAELPAADSAELQTEVEAAADVSHEAALPEPVVSSTPQ